MTHEKDVKGKMASTNENLKAFLSAGKHQRSKCSFTRASEPTIMSSYTLQAFCASQQQLKVDGLPESSREFLNRLGLPAVHPFCNPDASSPWSIRSVPPHGPLLASSLRDIHDHSLKQEYVTWFYQTVPPCWAFLELWLRLFAGYVAPVAILYLVWCRQCQSERRDEQPQKRDVSSMVPALLAMASSAILLTDSM